MSDSSAETYDCFCCGPLAGELGRLGLLGRMPPAAGAGAGPGGSRWRDLQARRRFLRAAALLGGGAATAMLGGTALRAADGGAALALAAGSVAAGAPAAATAIFSGGTVLPVDDAFSQVEALAIRGAHVLAAGSLDEVRRIAGPAAQHVDLEGRTLLPGFIEPHMHFALLAGFGTWPDIGARNHRTVDGALAALKAHAAKARPGAWITARQFDPSLQAGPDALTIAELDRISDSNPVFVLNASVHLAYVNSRALEAAGITAETPDPVGGEFVRGPDGRPNGTIKGAAAHLPVLACNPAMGDRDLLEVGLQVCGGANAVGITTFCDQATGGLGAGADLELYRRLAESGRLTARMRPSLFHAQEADWDAMGVARGDGDALVRLTGWKIVADGSNQGYTGLQREPYFRTGGNGMAYIGQDDLVRKVVQRAGQGWQMVIHGNGDRAIDNILDAVDAAAAAGIDVPALRIRIEHCSILHDDQIARIRQHGISPSFLIGHVYYWGQAFRDDIFGPDKARLLDRTGACSAAGITWTMHSDATVTELNPLRCIHNAVTRQMWREPDSVLAPEECVSVERAIRAVTRDAAWQCHSEHEIGSLEPGKFADLAILEADPRKVDPLAIKDIKVSETWMNGRQVYQA